MQGLEIIREVTFIKGYSDKTKPESLKEGYCADALNCFVDDQSIKKRGGYTIIGNDPSVSKAITGMGRLETGARYVLRSRDHATNANSIIEYYAGSGNWTSVTGGTSQKVGLDHEFVEANGATYVFNGSDDVLKIANGTTATAVTAIPKGFTARWFHNYLFVLGTVDNKSRLYWSNLNDPETFGSTSYIDVNPGDGDVGTALAILKDELIVSKKNRIWALTGFGESEFSLDDLGERLTGLGAVNQRCVVETGDDVYFLYQIGEIPHFTSIMRTREGFLVAGEVISDAIEGTMKSLALSRIDKCAGHFDGRKIWWGVSRSKNYNDIVLVYDTLTKGWTRHTGINPSCWVMSTIRGKAETFFGEASDDANCYALDGSPSDNGTAIDMKLITRMYNPYPERKCKWKYLTVAVDLDSDFDLDVDYTTDGVSFSDLATMSFANSGSTFDYSAFPLAFTVDQIDRERLDSAGGTSYKMQYKFANNTTTDNVTIREYQLMYKPRGLRSKS